MGATLSLTASTELEDRVRGVAAFNPYDYPQGVGRANRVASIYVGTARLPAIGPCGDEDGERARPRHRAARRVAGRTQAPRPLPCRVAPGGPSARLRTRGAREVFRNVDSMVAARELYGRVTAPVTLAYGDHDWSRVPERAANLAPLPGAESVALDDAGHCSLL